MRSILGNIKKDRSLLLFAFLTVVIVGVTYFGVFFTFYQQDEWMVVGQMMGGGVKAFIGNYSIFQIISGQGRSLSIPIDFLFYHVFTFSVLPYALFALAFHVANTLLVFVLARKLSQNVLLASIAGIFFATASISYQAIGWVAANSTTLPSLFFSLISLIVFIDFIKTKKVKFLLISFICAVIALFFKESALLLFIFLPLFYYFNTRKKIPFLTAVKNTGVFLLYGVFVFVIRMVDLVGNTTDAGVFVTNTGDTKMKILSHMLTYPLTAFSQMYIDPPAIYLVTDNILQIERIAVWFQKNPIVIAEFFSIGMSILFIVLCLLMFQYRKEYRRLVFFGLVFSLLSFLPYVVLDRGSAFLESRYYYFGVVGAAILFAVTVSIAYSVSKAKFPNYVGRLSLLLCILVVFFLARQIQLIHKDMNFQIYFANERKEFLASLKKQYPTIPNKTVFYITGNTEALLPNLKVPFQQGPGYTLMVWYYRTGVIPKEFLTSSYLWGIYEQGYREKNGKGFGYFWDIEEVKKQVAKKTFPKESVIALFYDGQTKQLIDITKKTKDAL